MTADTTCLIKCIECSRLFPSPIQFATMNAFLGSALLGNEVQCPQCGNMTSCNKENMYFRDGDGIHHGDETLPE